MKKVFLAISFSTFAFLFFISVNKVNASTVRERVLDAATPAAQLNFPSISYGPGLILPDSPLYFLDKFFQSFRLSLAIDPENRSRIRAQVAGERLAELRVMLARDNPAGIETALSELEKEVGLAAKDLADAQAKGKNVSVLAKELNTTFKNQKNILKNLEGQTSGNLKMQLKAARLELLNAKVEVEDRLPADEVDNEIKDDLREQIKDEAGDINDSVQRTNRLLEKLNKEASKSAEKAVGERTEAVKKVTEGKNEAIKKVQEKLQKAEEKKQEKLNKIQTETSEVIQKVSLEVEKAVEKLREAEKKMAEIQQESE